MDVLFQPEHYPWSQVWCLLRSVSGRHARGHSQTENKGTSLDCKAFFPLCLSLSISPSSFFNLFVRRAAAHFWSTVVCLCQMPKRLQNEEGHMKRDRVTVATVCNHTHTHRATVIAKSCIESVPANLSFTLPFTIHCHFKYMSKVRQRNILTQIKFSNLCWIEEELKEQRANYQQHGSR